jgi:rhamnosyltransferase
MVMHDDWAHKVCLAIGGVVIYDKKAHINYRQHSKNVDGGKHTLYQRYIRIRNRIKSKECLRSKICNELLIGYKNEMSSHNKELALIVVNYQKDIQSRMKLLFNKEIKTPYFRKNKGFLVGVLLGYF